MPEVLDPWNHLAEARYASELRQLLDRVIALMAEANKQGIVFNFHIGDAGGKLTYNLTVTRKIA